MVVNLIMRSCRPRSLAHQIGPAGQRRQRGPTYLARDTPLCQAVVRHPPLSNH